MPVLPTLPNRLLSALQSVLGAPRPIALHEPRFAGNENAYVRECIDTGWVSSVGKFVDEFERRLAEATGSRHAVAVVNGTAALHLAMHVAGVKAGDEVLVPALSFIATANAVSHCGAVPHFVDSDLVTMGMDPHALREYLARIAEPAQGELRNRNTGRRIAAIVPMHAFGHPVDLAPLLELGAQLGVPVVEDAAESLGSYYHGRHTGTFGQLAALSFNGNKIITTGGGGAILMQDEALYRRVKHLSTTAKKPHRWEFFHDEVAWNYRMPNINAALGCAQLEQLPGFLASKRALANAYQAAFANDPDLRFMVEPEGCRSNYWLNAITLVEPSLTQRDELLAAANEAGYMSRPVWTLLNQLPMYEKCPSAPLPVAERLAASLINLPSSAGLAPGAQP